MTDENDHTLSYKPEQLNYAEAARCLCGAGMAYLEHLCREDPNARSWFCSAFLKGEVTAAKRGEGAGEFKLEGRMIDTEGNEHRSYPFAFYELRSEKQPGAGTTRPPHETPAVSYEEARANAIAAMPAFVDRIDGEFSAGLEDDDTWRMAKLLEYRPWPNEVAKEACTALVRALRHNPPPLGVCNLLWEALKASFRSVEPNRCGKCNEAIDRSVGYGLSAHRIYHSDCMPRR